MLLLRNLFVEVTYGSFRNHLPANKVFAAQIKNVCLSVKFLKFNGLYKKSMPLNQRLSIHKSTCSEENFTSTIVYYNFRKDFISFTVLNSN